MSNVVVPPVYQQAKYLKSVAELEALPVDTGAEVAFIGRSNAGKSSALNVITEIKSLARTSKTPGRTQMINFFALNEDCRLVDLPGYGYAKVPLSVKAKWMENINQYLEIRQALKGLVIVMDIRHPLREQDQQVLEWAVESELPVHLLLTKMDKLTAAGARKVLRDVEEIVAEHKAAISVQLFSSITGVGRD